MDYNETTPRRTFFKKSLKNTLAVGASVSFTASLLQSLTASAEPVDFFLGQQTSTEKEFRMGVIGPAELSLAASQMAVSKATNKNAKEFAGFELEEAKSVTAVLKDLGTPVPPMDAKGKATLATLKSTQGAEFDKAYIKAQMENHIFLRDLAQNYLSSAKGKTGPAESQGKHLATLALATFKEHVAITTRILGELGG